MTHDEAIAHAQSETARADRERARRIAAEERLDAVVKSNINQCITFDGDTYYAPKMYALALAIGWFFDGVREVMSAPPARHFEVLADAVHELTWKLDEAITDRDEARREAARMREANDVLDAKVTELREQLTMRREIQTMAVNASKEAVAKMSEAIADRDRWAARNRELEERIAKIREVVR